MVNDGRNSSASESTGNETILTPNSGSIGRRRFLQATGTGAAAVTVAGCVESQDGDGGGDGGDGTATGDGGDGGDTATEGDGGDGGGSDLPDTITVGALGPADSPMGASIFNAAKLAVNEINNNGGVDGSDLELLTKDTKDDPSTTRQVYQELTTGENVDATLGIFGSENLLAIMGNIAQAQTVHLTSGAATPEAPRRVKENYDRFKYWFRVGPTNSTFLADSLVTFAKDRFESMGWEKIAFLAEDYKWTEPVTKNIEQRLTEEVGVEVTQVRRIAEGTEDFTPIYDELENNNVDGAFTALAHIGTTSLVQWAKQQRSFGYGGIHVPTQLPSYYKATKGAAIATFSQTTATPQAEVTDKTVPFAEAYNEANDSYPVYTGYIAYDAVYMLKNAIQSAGSVNSDDLVSALEEMQYTGTAGNLAFYSRDEEFPHDVKYGPEFAQGIYFQWQPDDQGNGVQEVIWPDDLTTSEYMKPPWVSES